MHSKHADGKSFFRVDLRKKGPAETIDIPEEIDVEMLPPGGSFFNRSEHIESRNLKGRALPPTGFRYWIITNQLT